MAVNRRRVDGCTMRGVGTILNGIWWTKECGHQKFVMWAGVVEERVVGMVMCKMCVSGG